MHLDFLDIAKKINRVNIKCIALSLFIFRFSYLLNLESLLQMLHASLSVCVNVPNKNQTLTKKLQINFTYTLDSIHMHSLIWLSQWNKYDFPKKNFQRCRYKVPLMVRWSSVISLTQNKRHMTNLVRNIFYRKIL